MLTEQEISRLVELGRAAIVRGNPAGAVEALRKALTFSPEHGRAHALLAEALRLLDRLDSALVEANAAIGAEPESSYAHVVLASVLFARKDIAGARRHYETAREFDPTSPSPLRGLASLARFDDRDAEALSLLEAALALAPDDALTQARVADLHLARGRYAEAESAAKRALDLEPEHIEALLVMGHVLLQRGDIAAAREHALWALRSNATHREAIVLLSAVKARESFTLGLWYRANAAVARLGPRGLTLLLALFVGQALLRLILQDLGLPLAALIVRTSWLAVCAYSWIGPPKFRAMVQKELEGVRLRPNY